MKKLTLSVWVLVVLSGCEPMYSTGAAPVYNGVPVYTNVPPVPLPPAIQQQQLLQQQQQAQQQDIQRLQDELRQRDEQIRQLQTQSYSQQQRRVTAAGQWNGEANPGSRSGTMQERLAKAEKEAEQARRRAQEERSGGSKPAESSSSTSSASKELSMEERLAKAQKEAELARQRALEESERTRRAEEKVSVDSKPTATAEPKPTTKAETAKTEKTKPEALRPKDGSSDTGGSASSKKVAKAGGDEAKEEKAGGGAVSELLKKASSSIGKGDLNGAVAHLENAHRLDPNNSKILYDIANVRYHQGRYRDAETFASRAVRAGGGGATLKKSWSLIANARKALGDNQGAVSAAEKAAGL